VGGLRKDWIAQCGRISDMVASAEREQPQYLASRQRLEGQQRRHGYTEDGRVCDWEGRLLLSLARRLLLGEQKMSEVGLLAFRC